MLWLKLKLQHLRNRRAKDVLQAGMTDTSAVTILFTPRLDRAPLTSPQVTARYCRTRQSVTDDAKQS